MVRTSTAEANNYVCPSCKDELNRDRSNRGYVSHKRNPNCSFQKGERDPLNEWLKVANDDNGSLITGGIQLNIGSVIEILGEDRVRTVTYVMGSDRNGWRACFRYQGAVPVGDLQWRAIGPAASKPKHFLTFIPPKALPNLLRQLSESLAGLWLLSLGSGSLMIQFLA